MVRLAGPRPVFVDRTFLTIAHRLGGAESFHRRLVLEGGRLAPAPPGACRIPEVL